MSRVLSSLVVVLLLCGPARAQMPQMLREEFHHMKQYGIAVVGNDDVGRLPALMQDPATRIIVLQTAQGHLTPGMATRLMTWVRSGRTLWFYDARLAPLFGMRPIMLAPNQFHHKPQTGQLGGNVVNGVATMALAIRQDAVLTGVGAVSVFLVDYPQGKRHRYGAIAVAGDTFPLLQFTPNSPALVAMRRDGRGLVVFKSLLWPKVLAGARFQRNLLEYSAGFKVPGPAGVGKVGHPPGPKAAYVTGHPAAPLASASPPPPMARPTTSAAPVADATPPPPARPTPTPPASPTPTPPVEASPTPILHAPSQPKRGSAPVPSAREGDRVQTSDQGTLYGQLKVGVLDLETSSKSLDFTPSQVKTLILGGQLDLDTLVTWDGRSYKGLLLNESFDLHQADGSDQKLDKDDVLRIDFARPKQASDSRRNDGRGSHPRKDDR